MHTHSCTAWQAHRPTCKWDTSSPFCAPWAPEPATLLIEVLCGLASLIMLRQGAPRSGAGLKTLERHLRGCDAYRWTQEDLRLPQQVQDYDPTPKASAHSPSLTRSDTVLLMLQTALLT